MNRSLNVFLGVLLFFFCTSVRLTSQVVFSLSELPSTTITADNLRVRSSPNLDAGILALLRTGNQVAVLERTESVDLINGIQEYWFLISNQSITGWIFGGYTSLHSSSEEELISMNIRPAHSNPAEPDYLLLPHQILNNDTSVVIWKIRRKNFVDESIYMESFFEQMIIQTSDKFYTIYDKSQIDNYTDYEILNVEAYHLGTDSLAFVIEFFYHTLGPRSNFSLWMIDLLFYNPNNHLLEFIDNTGLSHSDWEPPIYEYSSELTENNELLIKATALKFEWTHPYNNLDLNRYIREDNGRIYFPDIYDYGRTDFPQEITLYSDPSVESAKIRYSDMTFDRIRVMSTLESLGNTWHQVVLYQRARYLDGILGWYLE